METKVKKREWVKNAAIIFLAIMLVLTFFSNTIMNRTLPEVATQNIGSGTITAKIRGTGTVTANQTYSVVTNQTRTIKTVHIKEGQEINVGDVLFTLADTESDELAAAQEQLQSLNKQYQIAMINASETDYARENREIQLARDALAKAESERDSLAIDAVKIAVAQKGVNDAKADVTKAERRLKNAQEKLAEIGALIEPDDDTLRELRKALQAKEDEVDAARQKLRTAEILYDELYQSFLTAAERKLVYLAREAERNAEVKEFEGKSDEDALKILKRDGRLDAYLAYAIEDVEDGTLWPYAESGYQFPGDVNVNAGDNHYQETLAADFVFAYEEITACMDAVEKVDKEADVIREQISIANGKDNSDIYNAYAADVEEAQDDVTDAQEDLAEAETYLEKLQKQLASYEAAQETVESRSLALENLLFDFQEQQKADNKQAQLDHLDMQELLNDINKQKELIASLTTDATAKDIVAEVSGVVQSVNVSAGNATTAGSPMAIIEIPDMGYSMSFSVTNDQARKVHVGDSATISNYYWGSEITAVLSGVKTDPQNPQGGRLLVFDVSGDVSVGNSLTISVGSKSMEYDYVVPNSAIRSDSNGDFILVVEAQNSPLGNKYIATRVDVTVLASDDTTTAITGAIENGDFVITTSNAPISNGERVRMADIQ